MAGVALDICKSAISYGNISEQLKYHKCDTKNFTNIDDVAIPSSVKTESKQMILKRKQL